MKRRNFLIGATAITLAEFLAGCETQADLKVKLLKNSIPAQMASKFLGELQSPIKSSFQPIESLNELFYLLQNWQKKLLLEKQQSSINKTENINIANLVTLGDYWLANAIKQELIQPFNSQSLANWNKLPEKWLELVKRNNQGYVDPQGKIWAAPYQWGTTLIAYRVDKFKALGWEPKDWSDLWRPELKGNISLLNQAREVIGLTLKKLGKSYNTKNIDQVEKLKAELVKLNQQVKFYSSNNYLQPLIIGDTWLAVGWSNDILPLLKKRKKIAAVVPQSGTALWANLWVKPAASPENSLTEKWINFCWQPQVAQQMSIITQTSSPIMPKINPNELISDIKNNPLLLLPQEIIEKSEFLAPLANSTIEQYQKLWQEIRQPVHIQ
ncbi:periplasmic polyamine-binding protein of ABC transporter [Trichodesmium erythraeum IMS101]|uniref:Periplasmic polyamine-binding protein of ABC transporter n=1 Tax=Trichodesmium erythraeum (strain IMS101) TaxID=203124 RepID=Q110R7_TRIEI|nr:extracellular solute-binding protein [Trichodesmium erythraeum GBRTRLIN201]